MSHELRTPLNSLLILRTSSSGNSEGNLSGRQIEFAKTIHSSGNDLLMLINDILDLSKIESGTVAVDVGELPIDELYRYVERTFRPVAESRKLDFMIRLDQNLPPSMFTDTKRLQQIIKNLLSNAFKFTHRGQVTLTIEAAAGGWSAGNDRSIARRRCCAFSVTDTGIGIRAKSSRSSSRRSSRPTAAPAANTAAPAWVSPSAANCRACCAAKSACSARPAAAARSRCTCRRTTRRSARCTGAKRRLPPCRQPREPPKRRAQIAADAAVPAVAPPAEELGPDILLNEAGDDRANIRPGEPRC
jgi:hypothetical protein